MTHHDSNAVTPPSKINHDTQDSTLMTPRVYDVLGQTSFHDIHDATTPLEQPTTHHDVSRYPTLTTDLVMPASGNAMFHCETKFDAL
jgi:hypothetical protein